MKIIKAGIWDTVQDLGRYGKQHLGINPTGAMDKYAMQVANALVGNDLNEAVIEMHSPAAGFLFTQPALIAISGADFSPMINGEEVPGLHPIYIQKNDVLQFHRPIKGARVYIAIAGGIKIDDWLDSMSTNLKAKAGGYDGRKLQKDDQLILRKQNLFTNTHQEYFVLPWTADLNWMHSDNSLNENIIEILPGYEWERLTNSSKEMMTNASFEISQQSDRMGYRLNNVPLTTTINEEIVSSGVSFGTIQLLPDGKLIILMADHQTTGGYPRIAHVITAHHSKLAQMNSGDVIHFQFTDQKKAEQLYIKQQQHLQQLQNACMLRLKEYFK